MTLYQYRQLDECEQTEALWENGVHIGERDDETYRYVLYSMFDFYIELKYHRELNAIHGSKAFSSDTPLEPYLYNIDISHFKP